MPSGRAARRLTNQILRERHRLVERSGEHALVALVGTGHTAIVPFETWPAW